MGAGALPVCIQLTPLPSPPGDKKELLLKARFEALEEKGGKRLVNKAIEKKQKKVAAKEKKSRPFARGQEGMVGNVGAFGGGGGDRKRRRVG